jgi:glycosyltransferase involved in cell wall biosynthesis
MAGIFRQSVVLCTYNGARFLEQQLNSLLNQTRLPDEVVICDDGSSDSTLRILDEFKQAVPFSVEIYSNRPHLGPAQNFDRALALATGEVISLCDQDDEWLPIKLAQVEQCFASCPKIEAVFSDGYIVNCSLKPTGRMLWRHFAVTKGMQRKIKAGQGLEVLIKRFVVTGATLSVRRSLLARALPIPENWMHDAWLGLIAAATDSLLPVPIPLIRYRQHDTNHVGARPINWVQRWCDSLMIERSSYYAGEIARYEALRDRLECYKNQVRPDAAQLISAKLQHLRARAALPAKRLFRVAPILAELGRLGYHRYSYGWQVALRDLLLEG